jgi:DNA-binding MarR family transcriptional regulator
MSQVLSEQALLPWIRLLRAHSALTRDMNAQLVTEHGLTINDYEVMLHLSQAEGRRMRRVDLADTVLLTASGITRLLDGLERFGYVERAECASDKRVTYAVLTDAGLAKLEAAAVSHLDRLRELFVERYSDEELATLAELLARLPGAGGPPGSCSP